MKDRKTPPWQTTKNNHNNKLTDADSKNWAPKRPNVSNPRKAQKTNAKQAGPKKPCAQPSLKTG